MNNNEFFLSDAIDVIEEILASGGEFQIYPKGTSMLPLIVQTRDTVVLKRNFDFPAKKHDIAFYRRKDGQFVLHRVMKICDDGTYTMCGDNQLLLEQGIEPSQILGYVCGINRKGKNLRLDGVLYKSYVFFWCIRPVRRIGLFFRRVKGKVVRIFKDIF